MQTRYYDVSMSYEFTTAYQKGLCNNIDSNVMGYLNTFKKNQSALLLFLESSAVPEDMPTLTVCS